MSVMSKGCRYGLAALLPTLLYTGSAHAAGFYIQESSVSALGSAFSGSVSSIDDASTVYFNPAGMTDLSGRQVSAGIHLLMPKSELTDTGSTFGGGAVGGGNGPNPYDATPVPNLYFAAPIDDESRLWAGVGFNAPFGLANNYGQSYFGRFDSTETSLTVLNLSPVVAYKLNDMFSVGGGVDIQYARAKLRSRATVGGPVGSSELEGDDVSVGYNLGVTFKPMDGTRIGAHYRSGIDQTLDGDINLTGGTGADFSTSGSADLNLPDIATLGITQDVAEDWRVMGQLSWYGWSNFETIRAVNDAGTTLSNTPQNYKNTLAFSVGGEYDWTDQWTFRAGYQYDPTPTQDGFRTTRTPDGDRNWFTAGSTYKYNERMSFDFAAAYIDVGNEEISVTRNGGAAVVNADTEGRVGIVSAAINYKF